MASGIANMPGGIANNFKLPGGIDNMLGALPPIPPPSDAIPPIHPIPPPSDAIHPIPPSDAIPPTSDESTDKKELDISKLAHSAENAIIDAINSDGLENAIVKAGQQKIEQLVVQPEFLNKMLKALEEQKQANERESLGLGGGKKTKKRKTKTKKRKTKTKRRK
jgi:hypothetical protein